MGKLTKSAFILVLALMMSGTAWSYVVEQDGLGIDVSYTKLGQTVSFNFVADFTLASDSWIGDTMDSFSLQFYGNTDGRIDDFSDITSTNTAGDWTGMLDKVSGQGCSEGEHLGAICYTVEPTRSGGDGASVIANEIYNWNFDVTFADGLNLDRMLAKDHSIKFLSVKYNQRRDIWRVGSQLSQSGTYTTIEITEPGSMVLLGLGLIGLVVSRRKISV